MNDTFIGVNKGYISTAQLDDNRYESQSVSDS